MAASTNKLTDRIVSDIRETGPGTYDEIACTLGLPWKLVAGTLSNLRKRGRVVILGTIESPTRSAAIYGTPEMRRARP